ncbi:MAG: endoribonuclease MazF [Longimicrobiaceae bacterium]
MTASRYVPSRGDVVWMDLSRRAGHEQSGHRPALIVSPESYNRRVELALICPITSRVKGFPFEVHIPDGRDVSGVVLADQITSVDWRARGITLMDRLPTEFVETVARKFSKLLP